MFRLEPAPALRTRVRAGDPLVGVFIKSSSHQVAVAPSFPDAVGDAAS